MKLGQRNLKELRKLLKLLQPPVLEVIAFVRDLLRDVPQPGELSVVVVSEVDGMKFEIRLPALSEGHDVVKRHLSVAIAGAEPATVVASPGDAAVGGFSGADNAEVALSLVDEDDAGNMSEPRLLTVTLVDTIAPPQPGEMAVVVTGE